MASSQQKSQQQKRSKQKEDIIGGAILIIIGLLFLGANVYGLNVWTLLATYWPVILIIVGIGIIIGYWRDY